MRKCSLLRVRQAVSVRRHAVSRRALASFIVATFWAASPGGYASLGGDSRPLAFGPSGIASRAVDCDTVTSDCDAMADGYALPSPSDSIYQPFSGERLDPNAVLPPPLADDGADPPSTVDAEGSEADAPSPDADAGADFLDALDDVGGLGDASQLSAPNANFGGNLASLGVAAGSLSAAPFMTGDLFGGGVSQLSGVDRRTFSDVVPGFILNGEPGGSSDALLGFAYGGGSPDDVFTVGQGMDRAGGDGFADQFAIAEPIPPSDASTAPGPGFLFDGGTASYIGNASSATTPQPGQFSDGDFWFVNYSYSQSINGGTTEPVIIAGPDVATRRVKLSENFSPAVRNRVYVNYSFFNDAFGGLGDVSRWVLGIEHAVFDDLISIEVRQPMAGTHSSTQQFDDPGDRSYELGNTTVVSKFVLLRRENLIWSAGLGSTIPLADDAKLKRGDETLLVIRNQSVHLLPYSGVLLRKNRDTAFQGFIQFDFDTTGNDVRGDLAGGPLPKLGTFNDSALIALDASFHQTLYRNQRSRGLQEVIGNAELHYTGTLQESDVVRGEGIAITNLARHFNVLNATFSSHLLFGERLAVTPGISVPLRDGLDEQFDYEAMLQVNYLR